MVEEWVSVWKLFSLLFFVVLFFFLLYTLIEGVLTKIEFKRSLRLVKDQLFFDIFKNKDADISEFLDIDALAKIEIESRELLKELQKKIFYDLSKVDLNNLKKYINSNFVKNETQINNLALGRYNEVIKGLNNKVLYLKNDLDTAKSIFSDLNNLKSPPEVTVNKIYNALKNSYVRLNSSTSKTKKVEKTIKLNKIKKIEIPLKSKINHMFNNKDMYKYIDYIIKETYKVTQEKTDTSVLKDNNDNSFKELYKVNDKVTQEKIDMLIETQNKQELIMKESYKVNDKVTQEKIDMLIEMHNKQELIMKESYKVNDSVTQEKIDMLIEMHNKQELLMKDVLKNNDKVTQEKIDMLIGMHNKQELLMKDVLKNNDKVTQEKINIIVNMQNKNEVLMKENIKNAYSLVKEKDVTMNNKNNIILEQKRKVLELEKRMFLQTDFIENKLKQYVVDREYLDNYIDIFKNQSNSQKFKNSIFIFFMLLLFGVTVALLALIFNKSLMFNLNFL